MFAVIRTGGKQYRVAAQDIIRVDRLARAPGEVVAFDDVLLLGGDSPVIGTPTVAGASVTGTVLRHERGDKVIAFKKRRRKNSRRKRGYRHEFSLVRITGILTGDAKPVAESAAGTQALAANPQEPAAGAGPAGEPGTQSEARPSAPASAKSGSRSKSAEQQKTR